MSDPLISDQATKLLEKLRTHHCGTPSTGRDPLDEGPELLRRAAQNLDNVHSRILTYEEFFRDAAADPTLQEVYRKNPAATFVDNIRRYLDDQSLLTELISDLSYLLKEHPSHSTSIHLLLQEVSVTLECLDIMRANVDKISAMIGQLEQEPQDFVGEASRKSSNASVYTTVSQLGNITDPQSLPEDAHLPNGALDDGHFCAAPVESREVQGAQGRHFAPRTQVAQLGSGFSSSVSDLLSENSQNGDFSPNRVTVEDNKAFVRLQAIRQRDNSFGNTPPRTVTQPLLGTAAPVHRLRFDTSDDISVKAEEGRTDINAHGLVRTPDAYSQSGVYAPPTSVDASPFTNVDPSRFSTASKMSTPPYAPSGPSTPQVDLVARGQELLSRLRRHSLIGDKAKQQRQEVEADFCYDFNKINQHFRSSVKDNDVQMQIFASSNAEDAFVQKQLFAQSAYGNVTSKDNNYHLLLHGSQDKTHQKNSSHQDVGMVTHNKASIVVNGSNHPPKSTPRPDPASSQEIEKKTTSTPGSMEQLTAKRTGMEQVLSAQKAEDFALKMMDQDAKKMEQLRQRFAAPVISVEDSGRHDSSQVTFVKDSVKEVPLSTPNANQYDQIIANLKAQVATFQQQIANLTHRTPQHITFNEDPRQVPKFDDSALDIGLKPISTFNPQSSFQKVPALPPMQLSSFGAPRNVKIQRLQVPPFDGSRDKWWQWWPLFRDYIHTNPDVAVMDKQHQLRALLSGDAIKVVKAFLARPGGYIAAVSALVDYYEKETGDLTERVRKFEAFPRIIIRNRDSLLEFRNLRFLLEEIELMDVYFPHCATTLLSIKDKMPPEVRDKVHFIESLSGKRFATKEYLDRCEKEAEYFAEIAHREFLYSSKKSTHEVSAVYHAFREETHSHQSVKSSHYEDQDDYDEDLASEDEDEFLERCLLCTRNHHFSVCHIIPDCKERGELIKMMKRCLICAEEEHPASTVCPDFNRLCKDCGRPGHHFAFCHPFRRGKKGVARH